MDLDLSPDQQAFRDEIRAWLADNVPDRALPPASTKEGFEQHREWERKLYEAGYAAVHWPKEYGGRGADMTTVAIFQEEYARAGAPQRVNVLGLGLCGPTLMVYGSDEQKRRWLPGILSCDDIWSQGFSEPDAGSDLASLRTRAEREGDEYIVNGQKVWTSLGMFADWIFTLVRTAPHARKHKGITWLMIPADTPGVEVRPLTQINGDAGFAEVYFTDVRVPAENRVGEEGQGWQIAMTTLGFERGTGLGAHVRFEKDLEGLVAIIKARGLQDDPLMRDEVARLFTEVRVFRHNAYRTLTSLAEGKPIGPEASLTKLYWSEMETRIYDAGLRAMGPYGELTPKAPAAMDTFVPPAAEAVDHWQKQYWYARASRIYAGTSQIQKNIIAERVLGLPREYRPAVKSDKAGDASGAA